MRLYESWTNHGYLEKVPGKREKQFWNVSVDDAKGDSTNSGSQLCSFAQVWIDPAIGGLKVMFITELSCITFVGRWDMFHLWQDMFICVESDRLSAEGLCINVYI